ncbi:hypothetical protein [Aquimarina rhabdastrellae]
MKINYHKKEASYLLIALSIINIVVYLYLAYRHYNLSHIQIISILGFVTSIYALITISYTGFGKVLTPENVKYSHRAGLISIVALTFINFQIVSNDIISNTSLMVFIVLSNIYCKIIIFGKTLSSQANEYDDREFLIQTQKHLYNISKFSVFCILISAITAIISQLDIPHLIVSLIFSVPLILTYFLKQTERKNIYHLIFIVILSVLLIYIGLVIFNSRITPFSFSFYFLNTLSLILFHIVSIRLKGLS